MANEIATPQISTLVAELRIVKIGNKQMTLAVFKQLYEKKVYDDYYNIVYPVWGKVKRDDETFVVFQEGNELRKMKIPTKDIEYSFEYSIYAALSLHALTEYGHIGYLEIRKFCEGKDMQQFIRDRNSKKQSGFIPFVIPVSSAVKPYNFLKEERERAVQFWAADIFTKAEQEEIVAAYSKEVIEVRAFNKMVDSLNHYQQLFIAV